MLMTVRCDRCGRNTAVETSTGNVARCEHCGHEFDVPVALASLPRPKVPTAARPATSLPVDANPPAATAAPAEEAPAEETEDGARDGRAAEVVSRSMPWVLSLLIHAGIVLLMSFVVLIAQAKLEPDEIIFPSAEFSGDPGGVLNPGMQNPNLQAAQPTPTPQKDWSRVESQIPLASNSQQSRRLEIFGVGAGGSAGGSLARTGMLGGSGAGPRAAFYGTGGNAQYVVYVIDRSGSMISGAAFSDSVKPELARSLAGLSDTQSFHIVFFSNGPHVEFPSRAGVPRGLIPATSAARQQAALLLDRTIAENRAARGGVLDTRVEEALERAFAILATRPDGGGKIIYLLTDGEFNDNAAVLELVRKRNLSGSVTIHTILIRDREPEAERVLQTLAAESGGSYRFVECR